MGRGLVRGQATVFALAKRVNESWDQNAMAAALIKESLSIAADDYLEDLSAVRSGSWHAATVYDNYQIAMLSNPGIEAPQSPYRGCGPELTCIRGRSFLWPY